MVDLIFINGAICELNIENITKIKDVTIHIETQAMLIEKSFYKLCDSKRLTVDIDGDVFEASVVEIGNNRSKYIDILLSCDEWFYGIKELKAVFNDTAFIYFII